MENEIYQRERIETEMAGSLTDRMERVCVRVCVPTLELRESLSHWL